MDCLWVVELVQYSLLLKVKIIMVTQTLQEETVLNLENL